MTTRTFVDKNGNSWEWEETPETIEALKQLHETVKQVNEKKFAGNYQGPLYAPHPDLTNGKETN
jgi:hypothetical protein